MRVHKGRENNNGTYSIGKTWNLDDLTAIYSYTNLQPTTQEEQQHKTWAADVGFIVALGKNYYWQAASSREKDFFIGSLVKIFRKYTGGRLPDLKGFSLQEQETLTGASRTPTPQAQPQPQPPRTPMNLPQSTPPIPSIPQSRPKSPYGARAPSREDNRAPSRNGYSAPGSEEPASSREDVRSASRQRMRTPSRDRFGGGRGDSGVRKMPSEDQMSTTSSLGQGALPKPRTPFSPQLSQSSLQASKSPGTPQRNANGPPGSAAMVNDETLRKLNGLPEKEPPNDLSSRPTITDAKQSPSLSRRTPDTQRERPPSQDSSQDKLPERRRPPFLGQPKSFQSDNTSRYVTPTATPEPKKSEARAPSRGSERSVSTKEEPPVPSLQANNYLPSSSKSNLALDQTVSAADASQGQSVNGDRNMQDTTKDEPPLASPPPETPVEEHRPGLGPMIKKKSGKDIANQFRKAAFAASAFKPRAGGAGQRMMQQKEKSGDEPDGITGVVPAPLFRGMSNDSSRGETTEPMSPGSQRPQSPLSNQLPPTSSQQPPSAPKPTAPAPTPTPRVQIQRRATDDIKNDAEVERRAAREGSPDKPRSRSPGRRRRQLQDTRISKYCAALGFDAKVLEGRGGDFDDLLTELGWEGKLARDDKIETLEANVRREIGRAQASGWLGHIEQQEGKIEQLDKLISKTIVECDELDGLLTLYSHELNVRIHRNTFDRLLLTKSRHWQTMWRTLRRKAKGCKSRPRIRNFFKQNFKVFFKLFRFLRMTYAG